MHLFSYVTFELKKLSYQTKLLLSYFMLICIPLVSLSVYFVHHTSRSLRAHSENLASLHMNLAVNALDARISEMTALAKSLSMQKTICTCLEQDPKTLSIIQQAKDLTEIELLISSLYYDASIYSIRLFVNPGLAYANREVTTWPLTAIDTLFPGKGETILEMPMLHGPALLDQKLGNFLPVLSLTMPIYGVRDYNTPVALVCIDISQEEILRIMQTADYSQRGNIFLTDSHHRPILGYSNRSQGVLSQEGLPPSLPAEDPVLQNSKRELVTVSPLLENAWYLVICSPVYSLSDRESAFPLHLGTFALVAALLIYGIAYLNAKFHSRRIRLLSATVQRVRQGDLNAYCLVDSCDEIGELQNSFNEMVQKIKCLLDTQYKMGIRLKEEELKLLQAQINPHFLYNTLNLIKWAAQNKDSEEVADIVGKLSRYYRIGLSNGLEKITLREELEHVALYVQLQNKRFGNHIRLEIQCPSEVYGYYILKLLLQPIVENSITHGLRNNPGTISIRVYQEGSCLHLVAADDGVGICAKKLAQIQLAQELNHTSSPGGYGLSNIRERLAHYYGKESFLQFHASPGKGTYVEIALPLEKCEKKF